MAGFKGERIVRSLTGESKRRISAEEAKDQIARERDQLAERVKQLESSLEEAREVVNRVMAEGGFQCWSSTRSHSATSR